MARKKGESYTREIFHPHLEPYYIVASDMQFAVHKRIPSGHQLPAKAYYQRLDRAVDRVGKELTSDKMNLPSEAANLVDYVKERTEFIEDLYTKLSMLIEGTGEV